MTATPVHPAAGTVLLRPETDADRDFLVGLYGSTRQDVRALVAWPDEAWDAFVRMQFDAQDASYRARSPQGSFDIVEVGGRPAGRLYVDRRPGETRIVDITLLPEHRGAGLGRRLLRQVLQEAASTGSVVSLEVEAHSRASSLYLRLGFVPVSEHGVHRRMEWSAA